MVLRILQIALVVLVVDSAIQLALLTSMVGYLHRSGANEYPFLYNGNTYRIHAKPAHLLLNEGHTSNGAAGAGVVFGIVGLFLTWRQRRREHKNPHGRPSRLFAVWAFLMILLFLLDVTALAYTFAVTNQTNGQTISKPVAVQINGAAYPDKNWTPGNWFTAMLALPISVESDANYIRNWLKVINGWRWNLIPLLIIGLATAILAAAAVARERRLLRRSSRDSDSFEPPPSVEKGRFFR